MNLPAQAKGASSNSIYSVRAHDVATAQHLFEKAKKNLLDVNNWQKFAGPSSAAFKLVDEGGMETSEPPRKGSYLRIELPVANKTAAGHGFDWVQVQSITKEKRPGYECIAMIVRPAVPPFFNGGQVAHFFTEDATSTFYVERKRNRVLAAVYGRNEYPNISRVSKFTNKIRNAVVAIGAMVGINKPQWKNLVKGWLQHI
jgi:hypothetical protein